MKKYITILFLILGVTVFVLSGCKKQDDTLSDIEAIRIKGYLTAGVKADSPPFGYIKDGELQGIDIMLAKSIADDIFGTNRANNIKFVKVTPQDRMEALNSKKVDILAATLSINDKRKLVVNYSIPYFAAGLKLMVKKDSKIAHLKSFNTQGKLAVIFGTTGERTIHFIAPNAHIVGVKTYREAVDLLINGEVDGVLGDDCILEGFKTDELKIINKSYTREYYGVATRKSSKSAELLSSINQTIARLLDEKKIDFSRKMIPDKVDEEEVEEISDEQNQDPSEEDAKELDKDTTPDESENGAKINE